MVFGGDASPTAILAVIPIFTAIAITATVLRLAARLLVVRSAGYDDALIAAATVFAIGTGTMTIMEAHIDRRRRKLELTEADEVAYVKSVYASIILYNAALACIKISILIQYLRIFPQETFRRICYVLMAIVFTYSAWCIGSAIFFCVPVAAFWDSNITNAKCLNKEAVWYANAAVNIVTDIATVTLPLPLLRQLKVPKRSRIALIIVFALGGFTCLVSILRLESIYAAAHLEGSLNAHGAMSALWSVVEIDTGILCSCLPTLRILAAKALPSLFNSSQHSRHTGATLNLRSNRLRVPDQDFALSLSGHGNPTHHTYARKGSIEEINIGLQELAASPKDIRVVTVMNQETEGRDRNSRSEHGSTRDLIRDSSCSE